MSSLCNVLNLLIFHQSNYLKFELSLNNYFAFQFNLKCNHYICHLIIFILTNLFTSPINTYLIHNLTIPNPGMLISLSPLGNLSRYIRRRDKVTVHETALLMVEGSSVPCSGAILAARSPVLERVLKQDYEIVLEGFQCMIPQLNQVCSFLISHQVAPDLKILFVKLKMRSEDLRV